jgi:hypothetical protein
MKSRLIAVVLGLTPVLLFGQSNQEMVIRICKVHRDAGTLANLLPRDNLRVNASNQLRAVVLYGPAAAVASAEKTLQELDAISPGANGSRDVELVVSMIGGSLNPVSGVEEVSNDSLKSVVKQLRAVFPYKNYYQLGTVVLRSSQDTGSHNAGVLKCLSCGGRMVKPGTYDLRFRTATVYTDPVPSIHLEGFAFRGSLGSSDESAAKENASIETEADVDLREGQQVVVANSNIEDANASVFLVLSARLVP